MRLESLVFHGLFTLILLFAPSVFAADDDFSKIEVKATALTSSIYMLEGAGGNITAFIGTDGTFLVDDDFAPMADKLVAKLKELKGASPRFVVNTHFHYDHTGGNEVFGRTATIIAAKGVRERLMSEQILWKVKHPPEPPQAWPTLTYRESLEVKFNGDTIKAVHYPHGHTDGDTVVYFAKGKVVSMGDLYFSGMYPIFHPEHKGSLAGYVRNVGLVLKQTPATAQVVPGHGPVTGRAALETYYEMIKASIETVKAGLRKGSSLEQIQKAGLDKEWESFGHGYITTDRWIQEIYYSLKRGD